MSQAIPDQEHLLYRIADRIRQSLELREVLDTAVQEIGTFLKIDRVKIYRFDNSGSGAVIAEFIRDQRLPSLLGLHFPASDIPTASREMFVRARQRVIVDVASQRKILNQLDCPETGESLANEDIRYAPVDPCHVQYLLAMGVMASLVVPILHQNQLWGLLAIHDAEPRRFSERELQVVQLLVDQVSIAIAQSSLLQQVQQQANHEAIINRVSSLLHCPLNLTEIRQAVLEETVKALQGSGGRLYLAAAPTNQPAQLYTYGEQPTQPFIEESSCWQDVLCVPGLIETDAHDQEALLLAWRQIGQSIAASSPEKHGQPVGLGGLPASYIIANLAEDERFRSIAPAFEPTPIRSALIIPLHYRQQCIGCLSIFRNGFETEILWAGRHDADERNYQPRQSFEVWREVKRNQSPEWSSDEIKLVQSISVHIYMAVMQKRVEAMLRHEASHDRLTNLPNRLLFNEQLSLAIVNSHQQNEMLAVAFLDLDRFKAVNDTLGHAVGDQLLQQVTQRLQSNLRQCDTIARWGGDEFTLLFPHLNYVEDMSKLARRVLEVMSPPFCLEGQELYITASLGIALAPYDGEDAETLLKNADTAMYRAKHQGKNNYQFYSPEMNTKALEQLVLETDLRKALIRDEFLLYYQPQVDIHTGEITSLEALIRWQHPQLGLVPPSQFIPLAEETGLICPMGEWVIRTACAHHQAWCAAGLPPIRIAVNLSAHQFQQHDLVKTIVQILHETQVEPCYLELEITETTAMQDISFTIAVLQELRQMGIQIAMDDFGTGYSSLNSIKHFPLHTLKIDQSFVRDLMTDPSDAAIAKAIVALGQGLNLKILAEGVETPEQLEFLRSLGCDTVQGYLFSKPVPPEAAVRLLLDQTVMVQEQNPPATLAPTVVVPQQAEIAPTNETQPWASMEDGAQILLEELQRRTGFLEGANRELEQQLIKRRQLEEALRQQIKQEQQATAISYKLFQSLQLETILTTVVAEVRQLLKTDRVILYRFEANWSGVIAAESVGADWMPLFGKSIEDRCFIDHYIQHYQEGRIRAIDNIHEGVLAPCHTELLTQFQVNAQIVVPILPHQSLWGLLIVHQCGEPRHWQQSEINLLSQLATQSAWAIQQAELHQQLETALQQLPPDQSA